MVEVQWRFSVYVYACVHITEREKERRKKERNISECVSEEREREST